MPPVFFFHFFAVFSEAAALLNGATSVKYSSEQRTDSVCQREALFMKSALKALHSDCFLKMKVGVMTVWKLMNV